MFRGHGFTVQSFGSRVTKPQLQAQLQTYARMRPEVLAVVFCGHGTPVREAWAAGLCNPHGTMQLSGCTAWSAEDMSRLLKRCEFTGTLITFLNMCSAAPQQPAPFGDAVAAGPSSSWASHGQPLGMLSGQPLVAPAYRWVLFSSCIHGVAQLPSHASRMMGGFVGAAGQPYAALRESWPAPEHSDQSAAAVQMQMPPCCLMGGDYEGVFPGPA